MELTLKTFFALTLVVFIGVLLALYVASMFAQKKIDATLDSVKTNPLLKLFKP